MSRRAPAIRIPGLGGLRAIAVGLVLVSTFAPRDWIPGVNSTLDAFATSHSGVVVSDWAAAIGAQPSLLAPDRIHPGGAGGRVCADTLATTLAQVQRETPPSEVYDQQRRARAGG